MQNVDPRLLVWGAICLLAGAPQVRGADFRWVEAERVGPYIYRADFHLDERDQLLAELAQLQTDLVDSLGLSAATESIELYLFRDEPGYRSYLRQRFGDLPYRRALYVKAGGPGMVYAFRGEQFAVDLRHETTHALVHAVIDDLPLWLDEGLAEYFEVPRSDRASGHPHLQATQLRLRRLGVPRLEELERLGDVAEMRRESYVDAWAWVHFLQHGPPLGRRELVNYLSEVGRRRAAVPLSQRLRRQMPDLERRFEAHFAPRPAAK